MIKKGLGRGLEALIDTERFYEEGIKDIKINDLEPGLEQPRKNFDDEKLMQLSQSIKQHGVVQPIIVKKEGDIYRIIAGERRWRAARAAGLATIPAIIKDISNRQVLEIALIENLQREDLNPIEEAEAYEKLINEYNMTQEEISGIVGKSRSAVANTVRLLDLSERIKNLVIGGYLSSGHARTLMALNETVMREKAADEVIKRELNVRETEKLVKKYLSVKKNKKEQNYGMQYMEIEERLKNILGTKVKLLLNNKKGKILIEFYSNEELERILEIIDKERS